MARRFKRVAVLMGGPSSERDVSLRSGAAVTAGLTEAGYDTVAIDVKGRTLDLPSGIEAVFIALHGEFGEDGEVQSMLEAQDVPYTGSGPRASWLSFNKQASKKVLMRKGVPTPRFELVRSGSPCPFPLPVVVKPPAQGSSIGVYRVRTPAEWGPALADGLRFAPEIMVEVFIPGRELTVGIVGDMVLPVIEIQAPDDWYDYTAKYTKGQTQYLVPAPLEPVLAQQCQQVARATFDALGCRGVGRVDIRLSDTGEMMVLELNNVPGFTETSLLPKAAREAGLSFPVLCARILESAGTDRQPGLTGTEMA
ncbi:MAG: hypothetical protein A2340_01565 [Lentisphaerae bacterium RIFOXYB12_FULL_60_10]|nr:MAG: hypothetical protein A2340_01565 [Lentisphaerae bacterium RIFOXYB12_FULL_60_10]